jgi:hypothetical protein
MIEMAFILPVLLLLVVGTFEFGRLFFMQLTLQNAVREASRFTVTGNVLEDPDNPGTPLTRTQSIVYRISQVAPGFNVQPGQVTIVGPGGSGDPGGPGDVVTIRVDYDVELLTPLIAPLFPGGVHHVRISMIAKNEPFPTG